MRTTVTLDPDAEALIHKLMRERNLSFKAALNEAIRAGLTSPRPRVPFSTPTFPLGLNTALPLDRALQLAADLEDRELIQKLDMGK